MLTQLRKWKSLDIINRFNVGAIAFMQLAFIGAFVIALYERDWLNGFLAVTALSIVWLPSVLERNLRIHFPLEFGFLLNLFIYASIFLGELRGYYTAFWWWDIVLHTGSGVALGFIGFLILYSLYRTEKITIPPALIALFAFCFSLALGALWEIFEFFMDSVFGFNMQKSGLTDTMWDLIVDAAASFLVALSGYFYIKNKGKNSKFFKKYINIYFSHNNSPRQNQ